MVYDKRRVLSNYTSVPFGFKNWIFHNVSISVGKTMQMLGKTM
jgi:hypothetical protein